MDTNSFNCELKILFTKLTHNNRKQKIIYYIGKMIKYFNK